MVKIYGCQSASVKLAFAPIDSVHSECVSLKALITLGVLSVCPD